MDTATAREALEFLEAEFVAAKAAGTVTAYKRIELEQFRRWYRDRWRAVDPNGVQPSTVTTIGGF